MRQIKLYYSAAVKVAIKGTKKQINNIVLEMRLKRSDTNLDKVVDDMSPIFHLKYCWHTLLLLFDFKLP